MHKPIAIFTLFCFLLIACSKKEDAPDPVYPASRLSANVDGKLFTASFVRAEVSGGSIVINGTRNEGTSKAETIAVHISHYVTLASYPVDTGTSASFFSYTGAFMANGGSITITTYNDEHIAGSFAFTAADTLHNTKSITNGSFDMYR